MAIQQDKVQIIVDIEAQQGVRAYQQLLDESRQVNDAMRRMKRLGKENSEEFKKLEKRASELNNELAELGGAGANMGQLISRSKALNRELKSLAPGTKRFIDATKELKDVNTRLRAIRDQTRGVSEAMQEVRIAGIKLPDGLVKGINGVNTAFKALIALQVIQYFVELFQSIDETTKRMVKLRGEVEQFTDATGLQLDNYTTRVAAISQTFGEETDQVLKAANALTKQLTGDFSESLDLIEKGFLAGANRGGDFLDQVKEYPTFFREAGLSGEQMISTITQSVDQGVFSDKGVDQLKEFVLRIREMPKATATALKAIGLSSTEIQKEIEENGIGSAFTKIQNQLGELEEDAPEVGLVLADVFGGAGEDAGVQFIRNLELTGDELDRLIDTGNEYTALMQEQLIANEELAEAENRVAKGFSDASGSLGVYITQVKAFLLRVAADVIEFFRDLPATAKGVQAAFRQIMNNIQNFFSRTALNLEITYKRISKLNPFGKTSEQLDQEIAALRERRDGMKEEVVNIMQAYREGYLEERDNIKTRQAIAEALTPPPHEPTVRANVRKQVRDVQKVVDEEMAKLRAERANAPGVVQGLGGTGTPSSVSSTGESGVASESEQERLKNKFLKALITEQEYEDQRFELIQQAYDRRLEYLRSKFGEESAEYIEFENQKLESQKDYEAQRQALTEGTEGIRKRLIREGIDALGVAVEETINFLHDEEDARKKNSLALKAFSIGKVVIDTEEAIMSIIKSSEGNPGNLLFPGLSKIIQAAKIGGVLLRSGVAINRIRKQGFYDGGFTGNTALFKDNSGRNVVGAVHANEWVAPEWMNRHPNYAPVIGWLEQMRKQGFQEGGFAQPVSGAPATNGAGADFTFLRKAIEELAISQQTMAKEIRRKQFTVTTGQVRDALDADYLLDEKSSF